MHCSELFRIFIVTFLLFLPDEGDHSIMETLHMINVLKNLDQCMSEYQTGSFLNLFNDNIIITAVAIKKYHIVCTLFISRVHCNVNTYQCI